MTPPCPIYWSLLCCQFLKTSDTLALELWQAFCQRYSWRVSTVSFTLNNMTRTPANLEVWQQREAHFKEVLPASDLLSLGVRLSPETGKPCRRDVVQFEDVLLYYMNREGAWR